MEYDGTTQSESVDVLRSSSDSGAAKWAFFAVGGIALVLRFVQWIAARDLMIDEANLMRNVLERDFAGLLQALDYDQYAPVAYLWLLKLETLLGPATNFHLRSMSFFTSVLTLLLFMWLLKRSVGYLAGIAPLAAFGIGAIFLRYAVEIKQYGMDMLVTVATLLLFDFYRKNRSPLFAIALAEWGAAAIFLSMPSVFVLLPLGMLILTEGLAMSRRLWQSVLPLALWSLVFAANFFLFLRPGIESSHLQDYHAAHFPGTSVVRTVQLLNSFVDGSSGHTLLAWLAGWALLAAGATHLWQKDRPVAALLALSAAALLAAGMLHKYSFIPRLLLFFFPAVLLLQGYGWKALFLRVKNKLWLTAIPAYMILALSTAVNWQAVSGRLIIDSFREPLDILAAQEPGGTVYVHHHAVPGVRYYLDHSAYRSRWATLRTIDGHWEDMYTDSMRGFFKAGADYLLLVHIGKNEKAGLLKNIAAQRDYEVLWENKQGDAVLYFP